MLHCVADKAAPVLGTWRAGTKMASPLNFHHFHCYFGHSSSYFLERQSKHRRASLSVTWTRKPLNMFISSLKQQPQITELYETSHFGTQTSIRLCSASKLSYENNQNIERHPSFVETISRGSCTQIASPLVEKKSSRKLVT